MQKAIASLEKAGLISAPNPDLTAQILLGAIMDASHFAALSDRKAEALKEGKSTLLVMLRALRIESDL